MLSLLLIVIFISNFIDCKQPVQTEKIILKPKNIKCKGYNETLFQIKKCFIKPISRTNSSVNILVDLKQIFRGPIWLEVVFKYKFNIIMRQVYPTIKFDFCQAMKNEGLIERLVFFLIGLFREQVPQLFHECPFYAGELSMMNITIPEKNLENIPMTHLVATGIYRTEITISIQSSKIMFVSGEAEIKTSVAGFR